MQAHSKGSLKPVAEPPIGIPVNAFGVARCLETALALILAAVQPSCSPHTAAVRLLIICDSDELEFIARRVYCFATAHHNISAELSPPPHASFPQILDATIVVLIAAGSESVLLSYPAAPLASVHVLSATLCPSAYEKANSNIFTICRSREWAVAYREARQSESAPALPSGLVLIALQLSRGAIAQWVQADFSLCVPPAAMISPFAKISALDPTSALSGSSLHHTEAKGQKRSGDNVIRVWSQPSHLSTLPYLMVLLRICSCCPVLYLDLFAPHFRQHLTRRPSQQSSPRLRYEAFRVLCAVFENAICLVRGSITSRAKWFRRLAADVCQHIAMLHLSLAPARHSDSRVITEGVALRMAERARELFPADVELLAAHARCSHLCGDRESATCLYHQLLVIEPGHHEATNYINSNAVSAPADSLSFRPLPQPLANTAISILPSSLVEETDLPSYSRTVVLERNVSLSESVLWEMQRNYYRAEGKRAWRLTDHSRPDGDDEQKTTPFQGTSNANIATNYAKLVFSAILDRLNIGLINIDDPIYVIELGAGHGVFTGLFVSRLQNLFSMCSGGPVSIGRVRVIVVASDTAADNVVQILSDSSSNVVTVEPLVSVDHVPVNVFVDGAKFDAGRDREVTLMKASITVGALPAQRSQNPVFVIANYIFDSLGADAFLLTSKRELLEGLSSMVYTVPEGEREPNEIEVAQFSSIDLSRCAQSWLYRRVRGQVSDENTSVSHYVHRVGSTPSDIDLEEAQFLDCVLTAFINDIFPIVSRMEPDGGEKKIYFTFPVDAILCLYRMQQWSTRCELILLAADKALNNALALVERSYPPIVSLHGSLSLTVNFLALSSCFDILNSSKATSATEMSHCVDPSNEAVFVWHTPQQLCDVDVMMAAAIPTNTGIVSEAFLPLASIMFNCGIADINNSDLLLLRDHIEDSCAMAKRHRRDIAKKIAKAVPLVTVLDDAEGCTDAILPQTLVTALCEYSGRDLDVLQQFAVCE